MLVSNKDMGRDQEHCRMLLDKLDGSETGGAVRIAKFDFYNDDKNIRLTSQPLNKSTRLERNSSDRAERVDRKCNNSRHNSMRG